MSYQDSEGNYRSDNGTFNYSNTYTNLNGSAYEQGLAGVDGFDTPSSAAAKLDAYRFKQMMGPEPDWTVRPSTSYGENSTYEGSSYGASSYAGSGAVDLGELAKGLLALIALAATLVASGFVPVLLTVALLGCMLYKKRWGYATAIMLTTLAVTTLCWYQTSQLAGKMLFRAGVVTDLLILPWAAFAYFNHRVIAKRAKGLPAKWSMRNVFALVGVAVAAMTGVSMLLIISPLGEQMIPVKAVLTSVLSEQTQSLLWMMNGEFLLTLFIAAMPASTVSTYASAWFRRREAACKPGTAWWLVVLSVPAWAFMLLFAGLLSHSMVHSYSAAQAQQANIQAHQQQAPSSALHTQSAQGHRARK